MHSFYYFFKKTFTFRKQYSNLNPIRGRLFYQSGDTMPYKKITERTEKKIDALLDKIHLSGYDSLTDEEKEFLKRASDSDNKM